MLMSEALLIAIIGSVARIGLEGTALLLEKLNQPGATLDDAIKACRDAEAKTLADFKAAAAKGG